MPKRTKSQNKRMLKSIERKAWTLVGEGVFSVLDYDKVSKITARLLKKLG